MKQLVMMLAALGAGALAAPSFATDAAPLPSSTVSSYSAPTVEHVKKPKTAKAANRHGRKKHAAPAAAASE